MKSTIGSKSVGFQESKTKYPEVNPQEVSAILIRKPKLEWWPTFISIHQPKAEPIEWLSAGFRWAIFCGLICGWMLLLFLKLAFPDFLAPIESAKFFGGTFDISGQEIYMVCVILSCFILGAWFYYKKNPDREITFDKTADSIVFRKGLKEIRYEFNQVDELILEGHRVKVKSASQHYYSMYWCVLILKTKKGREKIISSMRFRSEDEIPYRAMLPMVVEIACMLQAPWSWKEYRFRFSSYLNFVFTPTYLAIWP